MDDGKIIELIFARARQAIREPDAKYGNLCRSLSHHIVNDRQTAGECINDAYLAARNKIPPASSKCREKNRNFVSAVISLLQKRKHAQLQTPFFKKISEGRG